MTQHWSFNDPSLPPGEPIPGKTYRADGWQYIDLPWMTAESRQMFMDIVGEGNMVPMIETIARNRDTQELVRWRGQVLVSPDGQERMRMYGRPS